MKQAIQRMLEALPEVRDSGAGIPPEIAQRSVLTRAAGTDGMTPPDSQSANPDQALREALQAELAAAEVDPERVLQALADWLASRDSRLATREMKPQSPSSESRVPS